MREKIFGHLPDGSQVMELAISGGCGIKANIITYGAVIKNLEVPDRKGMLADIILGQDTLEGYVTDPSASAALIGRVADRGNILLSVLQITDILIFPVGKKGTY